MSDVPRPVCRELRQESNFGCAVCGIPILEYHHIIPRSEMDHDDPEHMIALCPNHHRPSDDEAIPCERLYEYKEDPYISDIVEHEFYFASKRPYVKMGNALVEFVDDAKSTFLRIRDNDIIDISYSDGLLQFDIDFYSKDGELIGQLSENEWWADSRFIWDIESKSHRLIIRNEKHDIGLKISHDIDNNMITIRGKFWYQGNRLEIYPSKLQTERDFTVKNLGVSIGGDIDDANMVMYFSGESESGKPPIMFHIIEDESEKLDWEEREGLFAIKA